MTDSTLQRVWDSREAISRRCDYDARKLVRFCQSRQKAAGRKKVPTQRVTGGDEPKAPTHSRITCSLKTAYRRFCTVAEDPFGNEGSDCGMWTRV